MHTTYFFSGLVLGLILARIKAWALHRWRFGKAKPKAISLLPPTDEQLPFLAYVVEQNEAPPGLQIQEEIGVGCGGHVFKGTILASQRSSPSAVYSLSQTDEH